MKSAAAIAAGIAVCLFTTAVAAETYPSKPVRFIVAFSPGGGTDIIARVVADKLTRAWSQPVVVENRPGAGSNIGTQAVAKAPPDGYTILVTSTSFAVNPGMYKSAGYDPLKDFVPIINGGHTPTLFFTVPALPVDSLPALLQLAKSQKLSYATAGAGTVSHLTAENLFNVIAKADIQHIPFSGAGPAFQALAGGHVPVGALAFGTPALYDFVKAGKLKPIAISSGTRFPLLPDVPTIAESGFPNYAPESTWIGFFAPAGTPKDIVATLNQAIDAALRQPDARDRLAKIGFDWSPNTAEQFDGYIKEEVVKWGKVVKATGVRAE